MTGPTIFKLGGDALATPERIVLAARRLLAARADGPVVVVASARRGVTDHLLRLVADVDGATERPSSGSLHADRAVATGEIVATALLALALERLGAPARAMDAREAGLESDGVPGGARLCRIRTRRLREALTRGSIPVVAGFQGVHNGQLTTLGRGGSDLSAAAIAAALGGTCRFLKLSGLRSADPSTFPDTRILPLASHRFLVDLAEAGAQVIHAGAARLALRHDVPLVFEPFPTPGATTEVPVGLRQSSAVALLAGADRVTLLLDRDIGADEVDGLRRVALSAALARTERAGPRRLVFWTACARVESLAHALHGALAWPRVPPNERAPRGAPVLRMAAGGQ